MQGGILIPALYDGPVALKNGVPVKLPAGEPYSREKTIAYRILSAHDRGDAPDSFSVGFDALISHDITYVGIIQTARASGLEKFPIPYALTNCHNSLCAVGGTINEDDHVFGLSAARKYGGVFVPANLAVIHQYAREALAKCGSMVLGSDSHTRYGALGCMGVGEGGPELVRQLLENTWDIKKPPVTLVYVTGKPRHGVGPHDVAIALCGATYKRGFVKNRVMEFVGSGISSLSMDFRMGIDVMTTETACLSSVWETDDVVKRFYARHGRADAYAPLSALDGACYDNMIELDLSKIEPMIALPFHPSNALPISSLTGPYASDALREAEKEYGIKENFLTDKCTKEGFRLDQGVIAGCAGGLYENVLEAAAILDGKSVGNGAFQLTIYPPSQPVNLALLKNGALTTLMEAGALIKPCFCGPCFGAGDVPANGMLSARHTTRNFPNREGSKPSEGQVAMVALMDARSIAATAAKGGILTSAAECDYAAPTDVEYDFDSGIYEKRVYNGIGMPDEKAELVFGPNITDWPKIPEMKENLLVRVASVLRDPVTTTDELIPSGETSSYRSNPQRLAEFTLSRRDPMYVSRAKEARDRGDTKRWENAFSAFGAAEDDTNTGSFIYALHPGDGSAREQAASCQRVLGGACNLCISYATKRYRSNCINWGMPPFTLEDEFVGENGDFLFVPHLKTALEEGRKRIPATLLKADGTKHDYMLTLSDLTENEREILLCGCLMNYYAKRKGTEHA
ncbi:MAG: hydratase [Christensenellales bacterium]|jgi:aconitate hydratase